VATLRIYDLKEQMLALDLGDLVRLLAPRSLHATWTVSAVKFADPGEVWFEATGEGGELLETLAREDSRVSGSDLAALAKRTRQVIWGEFVGSFPADLDEKWMTIRVIDSTFYEITTLDETVLNKIRSTFKDVRLADCPIA
jgi:hypothetical protein